LLHEKATTSNKYLFIFSLFIKHGIIRLGGFYFMLKISRVLSCLILLAYCGESFAASQCSDLKKQQNKYESACQLSTGISTGCGALTALTTPFLGPFGLFFALPGFVASGVCAMRDLKKKWYLDCVKGHGEPWQKLVLQVEPQFQAQAQARLEQMIDNNKKYEKDVDTFIDGCTARGIDVTAEENFNWLKEMLLMFEEDFVNRAREIDQEYQEAIK
jgi:hypothetical protein